MDAEARLLLLGARTHLTAAERDAFDALVAGGLDWKRIGALAERHGLAPLLHRHLGACPAATVPKSVSAFLWARNEARARRNHEMAAELVEIVALVASHGIAVVPYKGPTLAQVAYDDLSLREFGDLDLLVRSRDAIAVKELLRSRGYVAEFALSPALEQALVRSRRHYELPLRNASRRMLVELHWRSDPEFEVARLDDDAWWQGLDRLELGGASLPALPAHELLLTLCLHGTKHFWASLGWLVDVAELLRREPGIDWDWILGTARRLGATRKLAVGLSLARHLLQAPVPREADAILADPEVSACCARIRDGLFVPGYPPITLGQRVRDDLRLHEGWAARGRYLMWMGFTPGLGEWQRWSLPRRLFLLYWPLRWVRLAEKYLLRRAPPALVGKAAPPAA